MGTKTIDVETVLKKNVDGFTMSAPTGIKVLDADGFAIGVVKSFELRKGGREVAMVASISDLRAIDLMTGKKTFSMSLVGSPVPDDK